MSTETSQPTVITLDEKNAVQILIQYNEVAQQKGSFLLQEADLLKRASDVLVGDKTDTFDKATAKTILIQGVHKGQQHGAYTLTDAALLFKIVQYLSTPHEESTQEDVEKIEQKKNENVEHIKRTIHTIEEVDEDEEFDLSDLAEPVPLKIKEI